MSNATAVQAVLATCQQRRIVLHVAGEKLTVDAPEGTLTPDLLTELRQHKAGLIELLQDGRPETETARSADDRAAARRTSRRGTKHRTARSVPKVRQPDDLVGCAGRSTLHDVRQTEASARESSGTAETGRTVAPIRRTGEFF